MDTNILKKFSDKKKQFIINRLVKINRTHNRKHQYSALLLMSEYLRRLGIWAKALNYRHLATWSAKPIFDVFNPQEDIEEELALDKAILELFKNENIYLGNFIHDGYSLIYFFKWELKNGEKVFQNLNLPNPYEVYIAYIERAGGTLSMNQGRVMETGLGLGKKVGPLLDRQKPFTSLKKEELDFADRYCQQYPVKGLRNIFDETWVWDN